MRASNPVTPKCDPETMYTEIGLSYKTGLPIAIQTTSVETMRGQFSDLETAWSGAESKQEADEIFARMFELQCAIEKIDGAMDNYADVRREARFGVGL